jgi:predicted phage terminase large subunit-like protein
LDILRSDAREEIFKNQLGFESVPTDSSADEFRETLRANGKKSLYYFSTAVLKWTKIQPDPHLPVCNFIQTQPKLRKVLLIPRDCYKSTVGSKSLPLWILIQDNFCGLPGLEHRISLQSHSSENAKKQIKSLRQQIERNQILRWLYPEIIPDVSKTTWTDSNLLFPREGMYGEDTIEAGGVDTALVSRHYTVQIGDDLEDKKSFEQPSVREKVKTFYKSSEALFVDEQTAFHLLIGTRWGHDDLYNEIMENEAEYYDFYARPLEWTRSDLELDLKEAHDSGKPAIWNMNPDEFAPEDGKKYLLFPKLFPELSCKRIRAKQGNFMYSMLYLNNPKDPSLAEFKEADLRWFWFDDEGNIVAQIDDDIREIIPFDCLKRVLHWDPAMSESEQKKNSRNAMVAAYKDPKGRIFVGEAYAEYKNPTMLFSKFVGMHQRHQIHTANIEDVGFQRTLKYPLFFTMKQLNHVFHVREEGPIGSKDARIRSLLPYAENHLLFLNKHPYPTVLMEEMRGFPVFPKKDVLDALAACLPLFGMADVQNPRETQKAQQRQDLRLATRSSVTGY